MLSSHEIESLRRSNAMAALGQHHIAQVLEACAQMAKEREAIAAILDDLRACFAAVRTALNDLGRIVR